MPTFLFVTADGDAIQLSAFRRILSVSGFQQSITASNDATFQLQANQYLLESSQSADSVAARVRTAAQVAGCARCTVVMAEASNCATYDMDAGEG